MAEGRGVGVRGDARFEVRGVSFEVRGRGRRSRVEAWLVKQMARRSPPPTLRALRSTLYARESPSRFTRDAFAVVN